MTDRWVEIHNIEAYETVLLLVLFLNQSITDFVFFHWLMFVDDEILLLIGSSIFLLICLISDLVGFMSRHVDLFSKLGV